jgi:uncharacterized protein
MENSVRKNDEQKRFELPLEEGDVAFVQYVERDGVIDLTHTEVPGKYEGKGIGSKLLKGTFEIVQQANGKVKPTCAFVGKYVQRHPEYQSLIG